MNELQFWSNQRTDIVNIKRNSYKISKYMSKSIKPRWQSYKQDVKNAHDLPQEERLGFYNNINSMSQSGWDFSSRWFANKTDIKTSYIYSFAPTDLNTINGLQYQYLYELALKFSYKQHIKSFKLLIQMTKQYLNAIKVGQRYPDYNIYKIDQSKQTNQHQDRDVYPSDFYPYLFFNQKLAQNPFQTLVSPSTSQTKSGQQWDKPNVWAPNNWLLHQILVESQAKKVAQQWVNTVYCGWKKTGNIYEKYRDDVLGERGEGGQYAVQTGFGWTNGLVLYYLVKYGDTLSDPPC